MALNAICIDIKLYQAMLSIALKSIHWQGSTKSIGKINQKIKY